MRFAPFVLAALCALVLFAGLDRVGVLDEREARDAQVVRELIRWREPLTPLYATHPLYEKPIGAYAIDVATALSHAPMPLRSRQIRAALALLLVLVTGAAAARHFGARAGVLAAGVLATMVGLPLAARGDGTQVLGTLLAWVGCEGLADVVFGRPGGRDLRLLVAYVALAAALVCCGPFTALWPLGGLALYLVLARDREGWRRARPGPGLLLVFSAGLPWYGPLIERHGADFLAHAWAFPYAVGAPRPLLEGVVLVVPLLVVTAFPWSAMLPDAMRHAATWWRGRRPTLRLVPGDPEPSPALQRERREEGAAHFFIASLIAALVPILFYPSRPLTAALPAAPAVALLCGRLLDHLFEDAERVGRLVTRSTLTLAVIGSVAAVAVAVLGARVPAAAPDLRLLAAALLVTSCAPFLADLLRRRRIAVLLMALPVAIGTPIVTLRVLPAMEDWLDARGVVTVMEQASPEQAPLAVWGPEPPSLRYGLDRNLVTVGARGDTTAGTLPPGVLTLDAARATGGATYVAFRPGYEHDVARAAAVPLEILVRTPSLVLARVRAR